MLTQPDENMKESLGDLKSSHACDPQSMVYFQILPNSFEYCTGFCRHKAHLDFFYEINANVEFQVKRIPN